MRRGLRDVLEDSGAVDVVGQAEDGVEAVRTAEESRPDVIVMDVMMPNCLALSLGVSQDSLPRLMRDWQTY